MKSVARILNPILFSFVFVAVLYGVAHGNSMWVCRDSGLPLIVRGIDQGFKCLCIVETPKRDDNHYEGYSYYKKCNKFNYYKEWIVYDATFAGFGCKGYCVDSIEWKTAVNETNSLIDKCHAIKTTIVDYKRLNACKSMMWTWE